jgi:DNA replication and repair protein RecF
MKLPPHPVVLQGDNAQGKTNLLEAVHMLATTRSHRTASDRELFHHSAAKDDLPVARLFAEVQRASGNVKAEIAMRLERASRPIIEAEGATSVRKRIRVNDVVRRAADLVGQVNAVMFSAQDIDLITGSPTLCRRYLDLVNSQIDSRYLRSLQQYHKVLLQRNRLLRLLQEHQSRPDQLEFWNRELVGSGSYLVMQRQYSVAALNQLAHEIHLEISRRAERLKITYIPNIGKEANQLSEIESQFGQALEQVKVKEIAQGITLVGPHRDNLLFQINDADVGAYGSRGQQRTVALSLKLAEAKYMHAQVGDSPVLLLDDVLSELDQPRRQHLLEAITPFQQVLITTTDIDRFQPSFLAQATQFRVRQGNIELAC